MSRTISAIVPTIGRTESLRRLLRSLANQSVRVDEIIVADGSSDIGTSLVCEDPCWTQAGLRVRRIPVQPPNAVTQRERAISVSKGELLLLLDDDVELEQKCVEELLQGLDSRPNVTAAMADFNNQSWPRPTRAWRFYLRFVHGLREGAWQGRVVGPLLRFGFPVRPTTQCESDWLGAGNSIVRRSCFEAVGGFSKFFLHRSTVNEDVDLGLKLRRLGSIVFCPSARMAHFHDPSGRLYPRQVAEDDVYNRFLILHLTVGFSRFKSLTLIGGFVVIEAVSNVIGGLGRGEWHRVRPLLCGRVSAVWRVLRIWRSVGST